MSDRNFDPEATREVGRDVVPVIAQEYQRFAGLVVQAGSELGSSGISTELGETFTDYHLLLRNATAETFENLIRLGPALVQIAEDDELLEGEVEGAMETLAEDVESTWSDSGYTPLSESDPGESLEPAPSNFEAALAEQPGEPTDDED